MHDSPRWKLKSSEAMHFSNAREKAALGFQHQSSCHQRVAHSCRLGALALTLLENYVAALTMLWQGSDLVGGHIINRLCTFRGKVAGQSESPISEC